VTASATPSAQAGADVPGAVLLRGAGLRATAPRVAALAVLGEHPHADADDVARGVRGRIGRVSTQAVYDVLRALCQAGLVRRIEPAGSPALFELRVADNHHHLVCRSCGRVRDVDCAVGAAPCLVPASDGEDFAVDEAEVIYWGTCARCAATAAP